MEALIPKEKRLDRGICIEAVIWYLFNLTVARLAVKDGAIDNGIAHLYDVELIRDDTPLTVFSFDEPKAYG
jgi:hypothetical protein